ncbi:uncharacterized protein LOC128194979 [Vigna angularis]|uniref:uncharacterized protein LOC128194979 n=1 Tax=Phaseolus angularis TaxID=3914 RepID=UPI0022B3A59C|nr:uncharacterized protein LOC128194979 [Vigna angularis]
METFKKLEITIPFSEALQQIPSYAKFLEDLLTKKKYLDEETIEVQGKVLVDLGASINLMALFMLKKICGLEVKSTKAILQMANGSIKHPYGVVEDVLVKIDKLQFPVDFVVMDMGEDVEMPLILGRPFMKTTKVVIHVDEGTVQLKDQDEEVTFNVFDKVQPIQVTKTSPKAKDEVHSVTSLPDKVAQPVKRNHSCCFPRMKEDDGDKEEKLVHHDSVMENNEP